jgi:Peptidase M1 N-terminal domain/Phage integrase, N-terminal SAM-like domain
LAKRRPPRSAARHTAGAVCTGATFGDAAAQYLRYISVDRGRKPTTVQDYRLVIDTRLLPAFGDMRVEDITAPMIERWIGGLQNQRNAKRRLSNRALIAVVAAAACAAPASAAPPQPSPGAVGIGDPLFPTLGNGGYDADHYSLALRYPTAEAQQTVSGSVTMSARATQALSSFDLDFAGDSVASVTVDGRPAAWTWSDEELAITPAQALHDHEKFVVRVDYTAHTSPPAPGDPFPFGWFTVNGGSVTAGQPNFGHDIYPVNDHPADKASYDIHFDVPEGTTAVANGDLVSRTTTNGRTSSVYVMDESMASELIQLAVGQFDVTDGPDVDGVNVRDVSSSSATDLVAPALARTPDHLRWMIDQVGRYPFDAYGVLAADQQFFYALETQTLSLHPALLFEPPRTAAGYEPIMVHELAHQ